MMEKMDKIIYSIIHLPNQPDNLKKTLIIKLVQSSTSKPQKPLEKADINSIFDCCTNILTTENEGTAVLAVFAFSSWAGQYKHYLRDYLTPERFTNILQSRRNVLSLMTWLKEALSLLMEEPDTLTTSFPVLEDILQDMLKENGCSSAVIAKMSEVYAVCPALLPQPHTHLAFTITLMNCVASFPTPTKTEVLGHMKSIGGLVNTLWNGLRLEDILHSLHAMYAIISNADGGSEVCPAMAHLLSLVPTVVVEGLAPRIVSDPTATDVALVATLTRLTAWLVAWPTAHATLGLWVQTLIKLLYRSGRTAVPGKITLERVPKLLAHSHIPVVRTGAISVSSTLLLSYQHSPVAFHKIIPEVVDLIGKLEREGSESALAAVNRLAILCHTLMVLFPGYPDNYQQLTEILMKYQSPSEQEIQDLIQEHQWGQSEGKITNQLGGPIVGDSIPVYYQRPASQRAGLRNLGNTCYMNSVIQALFMTDGFRHGVLFALPKKNQLLLIKLQHLFSLLCFSHRKYVAPRVFHDMSRPPWFNPGMQQDCSEYLRYLMITLHEEERAGQNLPEYQERFVIESETASIASDLQPLPYDSAPEDFVEADTMSKFCAEQTVFANILNKQKENHSDLLNKQLTSSQGSIAFKRKSGIIIPSKQGKETALIEDNIDENSSNAVAEVNDCTETNDHGISNGNFSDRYMKANSCKRKYKMPVDGIHRQMLKSPKGEVTSDTDNSSDSGISGDLADDVSINTPNPESPLLKEQLSDNQSLIIEELVTKNCNNIENMNEYFVSLVHQVFGGKLATCIKCLQCKTESVHKDVFTDIHLAFQDKDQYNAASAIKRSSEKIGKHKGQEEQIDLRIEDLIKSYLTPERLSGENQYECEKCNSKRDAERSIQILEPPDHLILTQLRFYYDTGKGQRQKVFTNVDFGEELLLPVHTPVSGIYHETCSDEGTVSCATSDDPTSNLIQPLGKFPPTETRPLFMPTCSVHNRQSPQDKSDLKTSVKKSKTNVALGEDNLQSCSRLNEKSSSSDSISTFCSADIYAADQSKNSSDSDNKTYCGVCNTILKNCEFQESCSHEYLESDLYKNSFPDYCMSSGSSECRTQIENCEELEPATYARYALYGVVVHSGFSSEGGHYYCYARNSSIACLPEAAKERYGTLADWYNFNDEQVTSTSFSSITNLTRTFSRDTVYQLFYKKFDGVDAKGGVIENLKSLRHDLQEVVENDNLQYRIEQDEEAKKRRCHYSSGPQIPRDSDHDSTPPPGGCGGGPGGGGFNTPSRVVF